ncbi:putative nuclease of restriction endonuclease-like (RecB) superfamily [Flavobacterium sp. 90]|uniref:PDDEXK nuclease domain-containing protein n=1 Tax=unclassified Flavobacterium TaxID=196869 RepID=UPI000EAE7266|nr:MULTISPECIES: PDDEXK nuclease domain-containing protein [unclassified Flavobacterium]RKR08910.1 putative nuclease of restriction endonuclease-like (RecB) superfamily [Flavobacterium sp. 81]TCK52698.1 putative nuclease of restriction endonuclease-like (RecB) superfamily [Flavobacterium sp. 90]
MSNIQNPEFSNIVNLIQQAQGRVRQYTNTALVTLYFNIGKTVSQKVAQGNWGQGTVQQLADYIQAEIPTLKSFNRRGLYRMKQFYETYCPGSEFDVIFQNITSLNIENQNNKNVSAPPTHLSFEFVSTALTQLQKAHNEKVSPLATQLENTNDNDEKTIVSALQTQLSWSVHLEILSACKLPEEKLFYLIMASKEKWGKLEVRRQIDSGLFERYALSNKKVSPLVTQLPAKINEHLKDIYSLEFLELGDDFSESDLQKSIVKNLKKFILEIGNNFSFVGEEYRVQVSNRDYEVDLLFYHRSLQCLVAFELKITDFKPEYLGKMNFYLEALDRDHKQPHENPSIGIILCKSKDDEIVEIAMSRSLSPTKVAEYTTKLIDKKLLQAKLHELGELYNQSKNTES